MPRLELVNVETRDDRERFIRLPWSLYANDPNWVPPLLSILRSRLDPRRHPYFQHAEVACFLAERDGRAVGSISAQYCRLAQQYQGHGTGHFGFFECEDSQETANALMESAGNWLKSKGAIRLLGPFSLSINDEAGLLVKGFHRPPSVMMGHHLDYYGRLLEGAGLQKEIDLLAYTLDITRPYQRRIQRVVQRAKLDPNIVIRPLDRSNFGNEMRQVFAVFREAWADNWGYVPATDAELDHLIKSIKPVLARGCVMMAELAGETAGFMVVLPNLNELLGDLNGRLFPTGWLRLLWRLKFATYSSVRVPLMGVSQRYQKTRMGAAIALLMIDRCRELLLRTGVTHCEMSWILENNAPMRGILHASGSTNDKSYRIYSKTL